MDIQQCCDQKTKNILIYFLVIVGIFFVFLIVSTFVDIQNKIKEGKYIGQEIETKNTISVSDTGEIYAKPDLALVGFSVQNRASTVNQAMSENTKKTNAVIEALKKQGIESKDLKTTNFSIYPLYNYPANGQRTLTGYEVRQSLQLKIRDLAKVSQIIQKATDAGANEAGNLVFTVDDEDQPKAQAREQAIEDAKEKAEKIAGELGVKLVKIISFSESSYSPSLGYDARGYGIGGGGASPEVQSGENKIQVDVSIIYEIY